MKNSKKAANRHNRGIPQVPTGEESEIVEEAPIEVTLTVPLGELDPKHSVIEHLSVSMTGYPRQGKALERILAGTFEKKRLASGALVTSHAGAIRWLLEQVPL